MPERTIAQVRQEAEQSFQSGLFCAEAVTLAFVHAQGLDTQLFPRAATAFCSGMARSCGTCGALTGAMLGIGLALGRSTSADSVERCYAATRRLIGEFEQTFGARDCHVLLGCDLGTAEGQAIFREHRLGERCLQFTGKAAEIAARIVEDAAAASPAPAP